MSSRLEGDRFHGSRDIKGTLVETGNPTGPASNLLRIQGMAMAVRAHC